MIYIAVIVYILLLILYVYNKTKGRNYFQKINLENEYVNEQLEEIYNKLDDNEIEQLSIMEKQTNKWKTLKILVATISVIILIISLKIGDEDIIKTFFVVEMIFITCIIYIYKNSKKKYAKIYKQKLVPNIIKAVEPELKYYPYGKNTSNEFENYTEDYIVETQEAYDMAEFDNKKYDKYYEDDYIEGVVKNEIYLKMANIKTVKENETIDENGQRNKSKTVKFEGMFVEAYADKEVETYIKISRNKNKKEKAEMDSEEFERCFDVFTEDRVLAMRILTHDVMETMIQLYDKVKYEVVLCGNKIYLRFFTGEMFEPQINGNALDTQALIKYYSILKFIVETVTQINKAISELEI